MVWMKCLLSVFISGQAVLLVDTGAVLLYWSCCMFVSCVVPAGSGDQTTSDGKGRLED